MVLILVYFGLELLLKTKIKLFLFKKLVYQKKYYQYLKQYKKKSKQELFKQIIKNKNKLSKFLKYLKKIQRLINKNHLFLNNVKIKIKVSNNQISAFQKGILLGKGKCLLKEILHLIFVGIQSQCQLSLLVLLLEELFSSSMLLCNNLYK